VTFVTAFAGDSWQCNLMLKLAVLERTLHLKRQLRVVHVSKPKTRLLHLPHDGRPLRPSELISQAATLMQWRLHLENEAPVNMRS
jgi:hypothetical protein